MSFLFRVVELKRFLSINIISQTVSDRSYRAAVRLVILEGAAPIANNATGELAVSTTTD